VHLKPGKAIAKKFENYIDENEYETSSLYDIRSVRAYGTAAVSALGTNEATADSENLTTVTTTADVTTTVDVTTTKDEDVAKDGDRESQHGVETTAWTTEIVEDSAAVIGDFHREYDDDDNDDDYDDDLDDLAVVEENKHEEKKLDCES